MAIFDNSLQVASLFFCIVGTMNQLACVDCIRQGEVPHRCCDGYGGSTMMAYVTG